MRVLVVGSGGREHALAWWCKRDSADIDVIVAPGNGGTSLIAENVVLSVTDGDAIARLAVERAVDLVVIGPDAAAEAGVADACLARGVSVFGPTAAAARIETSKTFAKHLMDRAGIPTARWRSGSAADREALVEFIAELGGRCVVKADGLALGKGVVVCDNRETAELALAACFEDGRFGAAGNNVVVEERLTGDEVSVLAISDGTHVRTLPPSRDHKRAVDGDRGPNTGGMGAVSPPPGFDTSLLGVIERTVLQPCIDALRELDTPFVGCLYAGLMLTPDGPRVLEFNARFGDPEAQVVLPLIAEPGVEVLNAAAHGSLTPGRMATSRAAATGVVAAAEGYPDSPRTGDAITGVEDVDAGVLVFHAGTKREPDGTLRTSGGRVLAVVAVADELDAARRCAYENLSRVTFRGMHFRHDIGGAPLHVVSGLAK